MVRAGIFMNQSIFLLVILVIILIIRKHKKIDICKCLSLLWSCYFILHFTVFDYPIDGKIASYMFENYSSVPELFRHFNFIPFHTIGECIDSGLQTFIRQVFGNIILFVPLGITVSWIFEQKSFRYRMYFIVTISVLIEITQLFLDLCSGMVVKSVDVDDILLNSLGGLMGVCFFGFLIWCYNYVRSKSALRQVKKQ